MLCDTSLTHRFSVHFGFTAVANEMYLRDSTGRQNIGSQQLELLTQQSLFVKIPNASCLHEIEPHYLSAGA